MGESVQYESFHYLGVRFRNSVLPAQSAGDCGMG